MSPITCRTPNHTTMLVSCMASAEGVAVYRKGQGVLTAPVVSQTSFMRDKPVGSHPYKMGMQPPQQPTQNPASMLPKPVLFSSHAGYAMRPYARA